MALSATARSTVRLNRIGLIVLHPATVAGRPVLTPEQMP
jgi:hypothetical protein